MDGDAKDEPAETPFELLGGAAALRALVDRFYTLMDGDPAYAEIRRLHPPSLESSADKLFCFLSGWLGGPPLYAAKYGHPMLRARHLPYPIGSLERDQWMACMRRAMEDCAVAPALAAALGRAFARTADWMRNKPGDLPTMPGA
jgi:hemoglobin